MFSLAFPGAPPYGGRTSYVAGITCGFPGAASSPPFEPQRGVQKGHGFANYHQKNQEKITGEGHGHRSPGPGPAGRKRAARTGSPHSARHPHGSSRQLPGIEPGSGPDRQQLLLPDPGPVPPGQRRGPGRLGRQARQRGRRTQPQLHRAAPQHRRRTDLGPRAGHRRRACGGRLRPEIRLQRSFLCPRRRGREGLRVLCLFQGPGFRRQPVRQR